MEWTLIHGTTPSFVTAGGAKSEPVSFDVE